MTVELAAASRRREARAQLRKVELCRAPAAGFVGAEDRRRRDLIRMRQSRPHPASHCPLLIISRSDGRSSVAAAAYAARSRMTDQRTGQIFNYRNVPGLLHEGLVGWNSSAEDLWNAAEKSEVRSNARVARELRPALPAELPHDEQVRLVHGYACWLRDSFGVAVHYVTHAPRFFDEEWGKALWKNHGTEGGEQDYHTALKDPTKSNLNFHAHIRFTTREVERDSGVFGEKTRVLDARDTGAACVLLMRQEWEKRTNAALERIGSAARIDLRSYADQAAAGDAPEGLESQKHEGPKKAAINRKRRQVKAAAAGSEERDRATVRSSNEELWQAWDLNRARQREEDRKSGESQRIADEREAERQLEAAAHADRIRLAETDDARTAAVERSHSVESVRAGGAWAQAISDAMAGRGPFAEGFENDETIDPENCNLPHAPEPEPIMRPVAVKRRSPRQRTRG